MNIWLWILCGVLLAVIAGLSVKIYLLRKSAREIREAFAARLTADTNRTIDISSRDRRLRELADDLNTQLRLLREQRRRYVQGDREIRQAVTNLSHDLRTPLTAISGYLDLLGREEKSPAAERYLDVIDERTRTMKKLTEELFQYSVILSAEGERYTRRVPVDLASALEESLAAFYGILTEKGIRPQVDLPGVPVVRQLNRDALTRVFSNILSNAAKYSGGDLAVTLTTAGEISFANSAPSLDAVQAGRLFERFYTVESGQGSTGLGLSIARTLVQQMGGSISADYRDGWLTIRLNFPVDHTGQDGIISNI
ncbi:MAG TPA: HAMP domain-containing histidine kinase [Candidatus Onthovicinus excrementipullorum]|nr:HAMP domain-containing histidine kinase [Candidatus Onthovicinus excrementipullorum]